MPEELVASLRTHILRLSRKECGLVGIVSNKYHKVLPHEQTCLVYVDSTELEVCVDFVGTLR